MGIHTEGSIYIPNLNCGYMLIGHNVLSTQGILDPYKVAGINGIDLNGI